MEPLKEWTDPNRRMERITLPHTPADIDRDKIMMHRNTLCKSLVLRERHLDENICNLGTQEERELQDVKETIHLLGCKDLKIDTW